MYALLLAAALTTPQAETATILKAIDNICGDTWCEGDYSFRFKNVYLNAESNSTKVQFTMSINYPIELDANSTINRQNFAVSCIVPGFSKPNSILEPNGSLNWEFYSNLTDCIQKLEARLSKVNRP